MFEVGYNVWDLRFGHGVVISVRNLDHGVEVDFGLKHGASIFYTECGKYTKHDTKRSLFFQEIAIPEEALTRPKFRAKYGEEYYSVNNYGIVERCIERGYKTDSRLVEVGNYFKTEEETKGSKFYKVFH